MDKGKINPFKNITIITIATDMDKNKKIWQNKNGQNFLKEPQENYRIEYVYYTQGYKADGVQNIFQKYEINLKSRSIFFESNPLFLYFYIFYI